MFGKKESIIIKVTGMSCKHCLARVINAIASVKGVKDAEGSIDSGEISVTFNPDKTDVQAVKDAVTSIGFGVAE